MPQYIDHTGERFGRWTVLYRTKDHIEPDGTKRVCYRCRCDCGTERDVLSGSLTKGMSRSCGCAQLEYARSGDAKRTHGLTGTRLHRIWKGMNDRCHNASNPKYARWGGRGISVCKEWTGPNGFMNFREWALAHGYKDNLSIDRIDNDGDYSPENCRWVDNKAQCNNKSYGRYIVINGTKKTIAQWSDSTGIPRYVLYRLSDERVKKKLEEFFQNE